MVATIVTKPFSSVSVSVSIFYLCFQLLQNTYDKILHYQNAKAPAPILGLFTRENCDISFYNITFHQIHGETITCVYDDKFFIN